MFINKLNKLTDILKHLLLYTNDDVILFIASRFIRRMLRNAKEISGSDSETIVGINEKPRR